MGEVMYGIPERIARLPIVRPTLLLDVDKVKTNIRRMALKAQRAGITLRPHAKTHQSAEIADMFLEYGIEALTVSSMEMALYFAENGWDDITVAFPVNVREMASIRYLSKTLKLHLLVDDPVAVRALEKSEIEGVGLWIKVDIGYQRAGIPWRETERLLALAQTIEGQNGFVLEGLLTHFGHTYHAQSAEEVRAIYRESVARFVGVRNSLAASGIQNLHLSIGDSPSCSLIDDFSGVDEIRPGNFVFSDLMQLQIGAAAPSDLALAVACPIVSVYPERNEFLIYGGSVHFSKDHLDIEGKRIFGRLAELDERGWCGPLADTAVVALSQEHGIVKAPREYIESISPGDLAIVLPVHACLTADKHGEYRSLDGDIIRRFSLAS